MSKEIFKYLKKNVPEISEMVLVRIRTIENSEDWNDIEILYAGNYKSFGFLIVNLRFKDQKMISENDFRNIYFHSKSWLNEISEKEFLDEYLKATQYVYGLFDN